MSRLVDARDRAVLAALPDWLLEDELARRRALDHDPTVRVGGLVVDPRVPFVVWDGAVYPLTARLVGVLYWLAVSRQRGALRASAAWLACRVWRGFDILTAQDNLRTTIHALQRRVPGLVLASTSARLGYGLALRDEEEVA